MYELRLHPQTKKQINKLHPIDRNKIKLSLEKLADNPKSKSHQIKKLTGTKSHYRLRVGALRIIFEPVAKEKTIYVWKVGYRGDIY